MKTLAVLISATFITFGSANASDNLLGLWASGMKEVLSISKEGDTIKAEFIRENPKSEFERVLFPAKFVDGSLVISSEQGKLTATYDDQKKQLVLGGFKSFQKLTESQALQLVAELEKKK